MDLQGEPCAIDAFPKAPDAAPENAWLTDEPVYLVSLNFLQTLMTLFSWVELLSSVLPNHSTSGHPSLSWDTHVMGSDTFELIDS